MKFAIQFALVTLNIMLEQALKVTRKKVSHVKNKVLDSLKVTSCNHANHLHLYKLQGVPERH